MVYKIWLNGNKKIAERFKLMFLILPLYSLLLWYLGSIYMEHHNWSWNAFIMNIAYLCVAVVVFEFLNLYIARKKSFSSKRQHLQTVFILDFSVFLLLQSVILFSLEQLENTVTIIITYTLNGMLTVIYVFIYHFTVNKTEDNLTLTETQAPLIKTMYKGNATFVSADHFIYFESRNKITFGYTEDHRLLTINKPLTELEKELSEKKFFRTNRQAIIKKNAIEHFEQLKNNTLSVHLKATDKKVIVSRSKASTFKYWASN